MGSYAHWLESRLEQRKLIAFLLEWAWPPHVKLARRTTIRVGKAAPPHRGLFLYVLWMSNAGGLNRLHGKRRRQLNESDIISEILTRPTHHVELSSALLGNRCVIALEGQRVVGDGEVEVLGNLAPADDVANGRSDLVSPAQGVSLVFDALLNLLEVLSPLSCRSRCRIRNSGP